MTTPPTSRKNVPETAGADANLQRQDSLLSSCRNTNKMLSNTPPSGMSIAKRDERDSPEENSMSLEALIPPTIPSENATAETSSEQYISIKIKAEGGDAESQFKLALMYQSGDGVPEDLDMAIVWFTKAAEQGQADAQCALGSIYLCVEKKRDLQKARYLLSQAAGKDVPLAQFNLGMMYYDGTGVEKNNRIAVDYFKAAAKRKLDMAQYNLGLMYTMGICDEDEEDALQEAVEWFSKSAGKNFAPAQFKLAQAYAYGAGVKKNAKTAEELYLKAAGQGHVRAQFNLAYMYDRGAGVKTDYSKAAMFYEKAAKQGHVSAQFNLGGLYEFGVGVEKSYKNAAKWYLEAAKLGHAKAQWSLGEMYAKSCDEGRDYTKAYTWFLVAKKNGYIPVLDRIQMFFIRPHINLKECEDKAAAWIASKYQNIT